MTQPVLRPRPDHVAEITRGIRLPLDPIAQAHIELITETISHAWAQLMQEIPHVLLIATEAELNDLLVARLNHLCTTERMWSQLVSSVVRGRESISFDGTHLERRPDMSLCLTGRHPSFPLVIECKILDVATQKGVDLYCYRGIARFVDGQYAWASAEGIMLGYVRDGSTIRTALASFLKHKSKRTLDPFRTGTLPNAATPGLQLSKHARDFGYLPGIGGVHPGPITLYHLWLELTLPAPQIN